MEMTVEELRRALENTEYELEAAKREAEGAIRDAEAAEEEAAELLEKLNRAEIQIEDLELKVEDLEIQVAAVEWEEGVSIRKVFENLDVTPEEAVEIQRLARDQGLTEHAAWCLQIMGQVDRHPRPILRSVRRRGA